MLVYSPFHATPVVLFIYRYFQILRVTTIHCGAHPTFLETISCPTLPNWNTVLAFQLKV
jgi:hypothetical protein